MCPPSDQALRIKTDSDATGASVSNVTYSGNTATGMGRLSDLWNYSLAFDVSGDGTVAVGVARTGDASYEAFRWVEGFGMVGIGDLPGGDFNSVARSVSLDGNTIVGIGSTDSPAACRMKPRRKAGTAVTIPMPIPRAADRTGLPLANSRFTPSMPSARLVASNRRQP